MQRSSSFDEVVLSQLPRIRAIGRGMLPRAVDLDDFVQDVVVRVYLKRDQLRDEERLAQWIAAVASNAARTSRRARPQLPPSVLPPALSHVVPQDASTDPTPAQQMESAERLAHVIQALQGLAEADRELLVAHYFDEQNPEDIRRRFGYTYTGFTTRLSRARGRLRKRLSAVTGLAAAVMAGVSRRVEAFAGAPVSTGAGGALAAHALLAGVVWLLVAQGRPVGVDAPASAALALVSAPSRSGVLRGRPKPNGSSRHTAGDAGYAHLSQGEYLSATSDLFDYVGADGLTVEAWYYFDEVPADQERWVLLRKDGSYSIEYWGPDRRLSQGSRGMQAEPEPSFVRGKGPGSKSSGRSSVPKGTEPLNCWVHFGQQYYRAREAAPWVGGQLRIEGKWHEDDLRLHGGGASVGGLTSDIAPWGGGMDLSKPLASKLPRTDSPLVIGGVPAALGGDRWVVPVRGRVGEVRVSSTARYPIRQDAVYESYSIDTVAGRFEVDEHTVALWHFDEGPGAKEYADASGNGHTLFVRTTGD